MTKPQPKSEKDGEKLDPRFKNELPHTDSLAEYAVMYGKRVAEGVAAVDPLQIQAAFHLMEHTIAKGARIYVAGNGGSAAISDHLVCDWVKGVHASHLPPLRVHSLASDTPLLTALANDFSFDECFSRQIEMLTQPGDAVILISSSGNSPNIIRAAETARAQGLKVVGLSGFSGGKLRDLSDITLYVPLKNYGMVEDCHQMLMHILAQFLAQKRDLKK